MTLENLQKVLTALQAQIPSTAFIGNREDDDPVAERLAGLVAYPSVSHAGAKCMFQRTTQVATRISAMVMGILRMESRTNMSRKWLSQSHASRINPTRVRPTPHKSASSTG